jgi:hypothetical protein
LATEKDHSERASPDFNFQPENSKNQIFFETENRIDSRNNAHGPVPKSPASFNGSNALIGQHEILDTQPIISLSNNSIPNRNAVDQNSDKGIFVNDRDGIGMSKADHLLPFGNEASFNIGESFISHISHAEDQT